MKNDRLVITREFNAPVDEVWRAWTEPEEYKKWWGPKSFTCPFCQIDLRVGGKYLSSMKAPDGSEFWTTGEYREIDPLRRIVYTDSFADKDGNIVPSSHYGMSSEIPQVMDVIIDLEEKNGSTKMTLTHIGIPEGKMQNDTKSGWNESFDKLEASLKNIKMEK
jgi:uncharacterized protein YndB with AHSA1/START domain